MAQTTTGPTSVAVDREWVRETARAAVEAVYGLHRPAPEQVAAMVEQAFAVSPVVRFPGFAELHPLFGSYQGRAAVTAHLQALYATVEVTALEHQFTIVDGFAASAHFAAELTFTGSGAVVELELVALVDVDLEGRARTLKLHFDTASFLKAARATGPERFTDVRGRLAHPDPDPDSAQHAGQAMARGYDTFLALGEGRATWEEFFALFADDMEVVFKSNVEALPYAGQYAGKEGFRRWLDDLFTIWSLNAFNFTEWYAEGNVADCAMHELHHYENPDGTKRYLDVYIVQSWRVDADGRVHLFTSYNDSAWLDETYRASPVYRAHYGYPAGYAGGGELAGKVPA